MKNFVEYALFRCALFVLKFAPFKLLYLISDVFAFLLFNVFRYRKKVIYENLRLSFPEKSEYELHLIAKKYYSHMSDVLLETIKSFTTPDHKMSKRFVVLNPEILDKYYQSTQSCLFYMAHYANWEWFVYGAGFFKHQVCAVYKPLRNSKINEYLLQNRQKKGMLLYPMKEAGYMIKNNITKPGIFIFISDQSPENLDKAIYLNFLNQTTAAISGPETIARKFNLPVFYLDVRKVRRGYYSTKVVLLEECPSKTTEGEITRKYYQYLETLIKEKPELWLWSHNRWKKTRK